MRLFTLLLWAGVSVGCWQATWAQQPQPGEEVWTGTFSPPLDKVASVARQWWENLQTQARRWSVLAWQSLNRDAAPPQLLAASPPVARQATGPEQVPISLSPQSASDHLCPNLPDQQPLLPQGASSLGELEGWFQAVDEALDRAAAQAPESEAGMHRPLVAPPASSETPQEDRLVLEEEYGCGCFDESPQSVPLADLVRDLRHSAGDQLALQLNEESDGLNDPPVATTAEERVADLTVTAPWLDECDDFCHMDALGPSQVEITSRPAYTGTAGTTLWQAGEELARRGSLALERIARGFQEAWQILRGGEEPQNSAAEPDRQKNIPRNARRVQEGDIGL